MSNIPVKNHSDWFRDPDSRSLSCSNKTEYDNYMRGYIAEQKEKEEFQTLQNDVSALKSELGDIKTLLLTLVQKNS